MYRFPVISLKISGQYSGTNCFANTGSDTVTNNFSGVIVIINVFL
ncbi:hypothetical protein QW060_25300 [Myroides ceti]|uniref:Uncharacterized protein n=1 Tax=Paenimyroides ceti TaxID=395087 RepID=A0ABT8D0Q5_9FLAO|nr:hypothetical protein [Paenimyroides ceti]MDN3710192.1 hypothetical protein [Paenimyroides ceti]